MHQVYKEVPQNRLKTVKLTLFRLRVNEPGAGNFDGTNNGKETSDEE